MNRTVGKLAGDGLWTFFTPTGLVYFVILDFVFFYRCFAGTVFRSLFFLISFLEPVSGIVSCGISAIICHFCPLLGSCMRREQKQSNPGAYSMGGRGAVTLPYCSFGYRNRRVVTVGPSSSCTSIHRDWLGSHRNHHTQQPTVSFKICQCVIW